MRSPWYYINIACSHVQYKTLWTVKFWIWRWIHNSKSFINMNMQGSSSIRSTANLLPSFRFCLKKKKIIFRPYNSSYHKRPKCASNSVGNDGTEFASYYRIKVSHCLHLTHWLWFSCATKYFLSIQYKHSRSIFKETSNEMRRTSRSL